MKYNIVLLLIPFLSFWLGYRAIQWFHAPAVIVTPSLIGCTMTQAGLIAAKQHLALRIVHTVTHPDMPEGTIVDQIPAAAQTIKTHQIISVTISEKPAAIHAPTYIGMHIDACLAHAQEQGITLQLHPLSSNQPAGTCFAQIPQPGRSLEHSPDRSSMILYISNPDKSLFIVPTYLHQSIATLQEYITDTPFTFKLVHEHPVAAHHQCNRACLVIDQRPLPGSCISSSSHPTITLFVRSLTR